MGWTTSVRFLAGSEKGFLSPRPDRPCVPPSLLSSG